MAPWAFAQAAAIAAAADWPPLEARTAPRAHARARRAAVAATCTPARDQLWRGGVGLATAHLSPRSPAPTQPSRAPVAAAAGTAL